MQTIKPFGAGKSYTLVTGISYKETDLIPIKENGQLSFVASIDTSGITVTPTVYYVYGTERGAAQTLKNRDNSDATIFTSSAPFECSFRKQSHFKPAIGVIVRFSFNVVTAGAILTSEFVESSGEK